VEKFIQAFVVPEVFEWIDFSICSFSLALSSKTCRALSVSLCVIAVYAAQQVASA